MMVWHWPSGLRWARWGGGFDGSSQVPLPSRPKVSEDQIHHEPDGRGQKVRKMFVLNSSIWSKTMGLRQWA